MGKPKLEDLHPFLRFHLSFPEAAGLVEQCFFEWRCSEGDFFTRYCSGGDSRQGVVNLGGGCGVYTVSMGYVERDSFREVVNPYPLDGVSSEGKALEHLERIADELQALKLPRPELYRSGYLIERVA